MRSSRFSSAMIGFVMGCLATCGRWAEDIFGSPSGYAQSFVRVLDVMGEFPASAKMRFEVTLAKWRMLLGSPDSISVNGLNKSSHHFTQRGVVEQPLFGGAALA